MDSVDRLAKRLGETVEPWRRRAILREYDIDEIDVPGLITAAIALRAADAKAARRVVQAAWTAARVRGDLENLRRAALILAQTHIVLGEPLQGRGAIQEVARGLREDPLFFGQSHGVSSLRRSSRSM